MFENLHIFILRLLTALSDKSLSIQLIQRFVLQTFSISDCISLLYGFPDYRLIKLERIKHIVARIFHSIFGFKQITERLMVLD